MDNGLWSIPIYYDYENVINAAYDPSTIHTDSALKGYFVKYLLQKAMSVFKFEGIPEEWNKAYFLYVLFTRGYIGVINAAKYGVICQHGTLSGRGIYYQPTRLLVSNPLFDKTYELLIDDECGIIKLQPNYSGIMDIVSFYADKFALSSQAIDINLLNTKTSKVYIAETKGQAESFKKMHDQIISGQPMVVIDKDLFNDDGSPNWIEFTQNLNQTYISDKILQDLARWEDRFNTEIGIPNVNTEKSQFLSRDEVNANNVETQTKAQLWLEELQDTIKTVNKLFGLNISVKLRFEGVKEVALNDNAVGNGSIQLR